MNDIFSIKDFKMPENFLWGSSTSAYQIEGDNIHTNWWHNEQQILKRNPNYEMSGKACNHYEMYEQDAQLLCDLGHKAFRLGVEWARIEPEEGCIVNEEVEHYIKELSLLKEKGIKTFVTLVHNSIPQWFAEKGDFSKLENLCFFEKYLNFIVPKISPYVDFWNVINEFNLYTSEEHKTFKFNSVLYHARGYHIIKQYSDKPVSSAHALVQYFGKRQNDAFDTAVQKYFDIINHEFFFHAIRTGELVMPGKDCIFDKEIKDTCDFWSINLYTRSILDTRCANMKSAFDFSKIKMIDKDFYLEEFYPECMYQGLTRLMDKPVYITENGCSCDNDDFRIIYIAEYLTALNQAIKAGVDVRGYLYWSLMDNFEWGSYVPRFGLVDVDRKNGFKRTPKRSAYFFKEIIENNGFSQDILRKYINTLPRAEYL